MPKTETDLATILSQKFDLSAWQSFLEECFANPKFELEPQKPLKDNVFKIKEYLYLGASEAIATDDNRIKIGFYYLPVPPDPNRQLERNKVGLRNLLRDIWKKKGLAPLVDGALIVFDQPESGKWRFSYVSDTKSGGQTASKRYTYLLGEGENTRTAFARFSVLRDKKGGIKLSDIADAFSVEKLSDDFFHRYRGFYANFVQFITGKRYVKTGNKWVEKVKHEPHKQLKTAFNGDEKSARDYIKKMLGRLVFLQFLQKKTWLNNDVNFLQKLFTNATPKNQADFLDRVLEPLFFEVLNTPVKNRDADKLRILGDNLDIPYLNGGLFDREELDRATVKFPAEYFRDFLNFFQEYNFTIDENSPDDMEVGIDPEMLGRIFESLLEDNKEKGAFYTPKEIVQYMCRESLIQYLCTASNNSEAFIRELVYEHQINKSLQNKTAATHLDKCLRKVKICDPAIGSGAFPMGLLHELLALRKLLYPHLNNSETFDPAAVKREIIQENIYGVDLEQGAVDIARLRFWLALVVDETKPQPLPNLDYKIMQGNSLLESFADVDLSFKPQVKKELDLTGANQREKDIKQLLHDYYNASLIDKFNLKEKIEATILEHLKLCCGDNAKRLAQFEKISPTNRPFFLWHIYFKEVFDNGGFDIVIGNPPYVEAKKLKHISALLKNYEVYSGTADLSSYFFELGVKLCKNAGLLNLISTNKFFNTGYGKSVRKLIIENEIKGILNFEQVEVFENVLVSSVVIAIQKKVPLKNNQFSYKKFFKIKHTAFAEVFLNEIKNLELYKQEHLTEKEWSFADNSNLTLKNKIEENATLLKNLNGVSVYRGVTTGFNPAFIINEKQKNEFIKSDKKLLQVIKPLLQGRNIRKWVYNASDDYLLQTGFDLDIKGKYPLIFQHLSNFKIDLEIRSDKGKNWWNLRACKYYSEFENPKIIWGLTADKWAYAYDDKGHYLPSNGYILTSKEVPIKYLLALLNSNLLKYYFGFIGVMTAGGAYTLKHSTIQELPIIIAEKQQPFIKLVDQILSAKKANPSSDTSKLESAIDQLVYELYDLTPAEIAIVEGK